MKFCRSRADCGSQTEPQQAGAALSLGQKSPSIYTSAQTKPSKGAERAFRSLYSIGSVLDLHPRDARLSPRTWKLRGCQNESLLRGRGIRRTILTINEIDGTMSKHVLGPPTLETLVQACLRATMSKYKSCPADDHHNRASERVQANGSYYHRCNGARTPSDGRETLPSPAQSGEHRSNSHRTLLLVIIRELADVHLGPIVAQDHRQTNAIDHIKGTTTRYHQKICGEQELRKRTPSYQAMLGTADALISSSESFSLSGCDISTIRLECEFHKRQSRFPYFTFH
ncbi:hypothetical protein U1Q18_044775 [Sarracenia purpurea var. burkii]